MTDPSKDEIDGELELAIMGYDRNDKYPEWSNASMREAYRAGWEDGREPLNQVRELVDEWESTGHLDYAKLRSLVHATEVPR